MGAKGFEFVLKRQLLPINSMQPWEDTKKRAQESLAVWSQRAPGLKVGAQGPEVLAGYIAEFEPLAQEIVTVQDGYDATTRAAEASLDKLKVLGVKVPQLIEGHLDDNEGLQAELRKIFRTAPRTEATILVRARELYPIWLLADEAMAALVPPQPPITRRIQKVEYTAAMLKALIDGYSDLIKAMTLQAKLLAESKAKMKALAEVTDGLNKRWFKLMSHSFDPGSDEHAALQSISTEPFARVPVVLEIKSIKQGGLQGRQVLIRYAKTGGDHATRSFVKWQVVGVDADFVNQLPLDKEGNALGPFDAGTELRIVAEVANSVGSRTTAPRSMVIAESIG